MHSLSRIRLLVTVLAAVALMALGQAVAQHLDHPSQVTALDAQSHGLTTVAAHPETSVAVIASLAIVDHRQTPAPRRKHGPDPIVTLAFAAAARKSSRKRAARKEADSGSSDAEDVPMFLDSDVHVMVEGQLTVVRGGRLLSEVEEDLSEDQVDELVARRVVRPATPREIEAAESRDAARDRAETVRAQQVEMSSLRAQQEAQLAALEEGGRRASEEERSALVSEHAEAMAALRERHAEQLNG
jgi:hypothetical protein